MAIAPKITAQRYDADTYRMMLGDTIVGTATRMADGTWRAKTLDDKIFGKPLGTPKAVAREFHMMARNYRADATRQLIDDLSAEKTAA